MTLNCILRKRATDMHDYKKLSSHTRACQEIRNSTDCSAFKYLSRIQFRLTTPTALTTSLLSRCQSLSAGHLTRPGLYTSIRQPLTSLTEQTFSATIFSFAHSTWATLVFFKPLECPLPVPVSEPLN